MNDTQHPQSEDADRQIESSGKPIENTPPTQPATGQQLQKTEQKIEERMSAFERSTIRLTRLGIFVGVLTAIIFAGQLYEMHEGGAQTDKMIDAANRNACAARSFAQSAGGIDTKIGTAEGDFFNMAKNSSDAIKATQESMRLEQRAWVSAAQITGIPMIDQPFVTKVTAINSGRTFAKHFKMVSMVQIGPAGMKPDFDKEGGQVYKSLSLLVPNAPYIATNTVTGEGSTPLLPNPKKVDIDRFKHGQSTVFAFGRMDYDDIFGKHHWSIFCYQLSPDIVWNACGMHNDADRN